MTTLLAPTVSFRPVSDADQPYLLKLYASTRAHEFAHTDWSQANIDDFIMRQFKLQSDAYAASFPGASFVIIQLDGVDVGRLYVDRQDRCLQMIEFTVAPEWRGRGIGTDILRALMNEAHGGKVPVRLSVLKDSPALDLYRRHGFLITADKGAYVGMEWMPDTGPRVI
ncbi:MAG: GNAT family N-acetyltransferase [Sulfitobacter sp.]